jgi:hypothetical protein
MTLAINPHDAEEQLRPALGAVFDATDECLAYTARGEEPPYELMLTQLRVTNAALDQALTLLGVRQ